jgi:hypothetical protein
MSTVLSDGSCWYSVVSVESGSNLNGIVKSWPVHRRGSEGDGFVFEEWDKEMRCPPGTEDEQVDGFEAEHFYR